MVRVGQECDEWAKSIGSWSLECKEWDKRMVNLIWNRSGTFMVKNFEKRLLKGVSGMYFSTFQTTLWLWYTFPLIYF